ncbi:hypothetical protein FGO68_gene1246 [Halteria grandinella]|uniref:Uncharacterized protein n=1 Tax=Halteria grandinella TaxID=5974 RepID=A0A8J8NG51_HALGN|nr:hypothetical protein FGO68_gene1246 [Halteria grandinella]
MTALVQQLFYVGSCTQSLQLHEVLLLQWEVTLLTLKISSSFPKIIVLRMLLGVNFKVDTPRIEHQHDDCLWIERFIFKPPCIKAGRSDYFRYYLQLVRLRTFKQQQINISHCYIKQFLNQGINNQKLRFSIINKLPSSPSPRKLKRTQCRKRTKFNLNSSAFQPSSNISIQAAQQPSRNKPSLKMIECNSQDFQPYLRLSKRAGSYSNTPQSQPLPQRRPPLRTQWTLQPRPHMRIQTLETKMKHSCALLCQFLMTRGQMTRRSNNPRFTRKIKIFVRSRTRRIQRSSIKSFRMRKDSASSRWL